MGDASKPSNTLAVILVVVALLTLGGVATWLNILKSESDKKDINATQQIKQPGDLDKVAYVAEPNKSILEQLQTQTRTVEVKNSQYGKYVHSINGQQGGVDNKYWTFYIDGKHADKDAAEYITKGGEKVEWRLE